MCWFPQIKFLKTIYRPLDIFKLCMGSVLTFSDFLIVVKEFHLIRDSFYKSLFYL
ncbi:hypothetical protein [Leptospira kirschneri]|nr:hypothetical protein [Leptospira kirschneri]